MNFQQTPLPVRLVYSRDYYGSHVCVSSVRFVNQKSSQVNMSVHTLAQVGDCAVACVDEGKIVDDLDEDPYVPE